VGSGNGKKSYRTGKKITVIHKAVGNLTHKLLKTMGNPTQQKERKMGEDFEITENGLEFKQDIRIVRSCDGDERRQLIADTLTLNRFIRYAQMMDDIHINRVIARAKSNVSFALTKTQNHIVILIGIIRVYNKVGRKFPITQVWLAGRYGINRKTVRAVLEDAISEGLLDENYFPTQPLIRAYGEFVERICNMKSTRTFTRSVGYGLMLEAAPDDLEFEQMLEDSVQIGTSDVPKL